MRTADAVIVGGGVTGVSIAFHLVSAGVRRVLVLERTFLASGGTGRSVGIIRQLYPTRETSEMVLRSLAVFTRFDEAVGGDAGFVRSGALIGVSDSMRPTLERTLALQRDIGIRAEILAPSDLGRVEARIAPAGLGAVLWEPDSGYGDPTAVTAGFAASARRQGAVIEQGAEVVAIRHRAGRIVGVDTASGDSIDAPIVINAAGLWAPRVAALASVALPIVIGRHPVFLVTRDPAFGPAHPVYLDLAGGSYVRPETGGLTITGSLTDDETQHPMDPDLLGGEAGFDEASVVLARTAKAIPALADARFSRGYVGAFDITPDWMPILDESPVSGFWIAAGMSGHGFKLSPAVGEMVAALVTGARPPVSPVPFRFNRFDQPAARTTFVSSYLQPPTSMLSTSNPDQSGRG
jgi:sarcosine oxidase subunit beta